MDSDNLKNIPQEIVDTTAREEEAAVQEQETTDGQDSSNSKPADEKSTAKKEKRRRKTADEEVADGMALKQVIADQAREDEREGSFNQSLKKVLVGELLNSKLVKGNIGLMVLVVFFVVISITNRYTVQQSLLEQSRLKKELQDTKFRALSANSDLTERTRKSRILEALRTQQDSTLKDPPHPAFLIEVPAK